MTITMIYQFTFFTGLLALFGRMEEKRKHCLLFRPTLPMEECSIALIILSLHFLRVILLINIDKVNFVKRFWLLGSAADPSAGDSSRNYSTTFMDKFFEQWYVALSLCHMKCWLQTPLYHVCCRYAPILMHPAVKVIVVIWLAVYLAIGIYGCLALREGLRPINLLQATSYAVPYYTAWEKYFWPYGVQMQVVVRNAMNMSTPEGQHKVRLYSC